MSARLQFAHVCASLLLVDFPLSRETRATLQSLQSSLALPDDYGKRIEQKLVEQLDTLRHLAGKGDEFFAAVEAIAAEADRDFALENCSTPLIPAASSVNPVEQRVQEPASKPWLLIGMVSVFVVAGLGLAAIAAYSLVQLPPASSSPGVPAPQPSQTTQPVAANPDPASPSPAATASASPLPSQETTLQPSPTPASPNPSSPQPTGVIGNPADAVSDRLKQLGIDPNYFNHLYQNYYAERSRGEETAAEQQENTTTLIKILAGMSPESRTKLGQYFGNEALRLDARRDALSRSRQFRDDIDQETDRQFNLLFPAWAEKDLRGTGMEEVWFGIQEDVIAAREKAALPP